MVLKIVALVLDMHIMIMMKELAIQTINVLQYANGVIGANGVHANRTVRKDGEFKGVLIMKIRKMLLALVLVSGLNCAVITLLMNAKNVLINMINVTKYRRVFVLMFVMQLE